MSAFDPRRPLVISGKVGQRGSIQTFWLNGHPISTDIHRQLSSHVGETALCFLTYFQANSEQEFRLDFEQ